MGKEGSMQVLVLGMPRTGTTSIRLALRQLGYERHYYWDSVAANARFGKKDAEKWLRLLDKKLKRCEPITREDFDDVLDGYVSLADWPCALFAEDLLAAYPDAKVILTVRDSAEAWHRSFLNTVWRFQRRKHFPRGFSERFWHMFQKNSAPQRMMTMVMYNTPMLNFPESGREWYLSHNEKLRDIVAPDRLLEFNAKQGWGPLCSFLGENVPENQFPSANSTEKFQRGIEGMWLCFKYSHSRRLLRRVTLAFLALTLILLCLEFMWPVIVANRANLGPLLE